ncbi:MAG TPA: Slp family lipoprotein [Nitrospira sp.]|nr:Slp family lipoprotein [Nitrospira sp.]
MTTPFRWQRIPLYPTLLELTLWYTRGMSGRASSLIPLLFFASIGCASTNQDMPDLGQAGSISFPQLKAAPNSYKGQSVVFGGEVLAARRTKDETRIEILQLPLDGSGYPGADLTQSQGRFLAIQKDFLDPATLPHGTRLTVSGKVSGAITLPLDETEYTYPIIEVKRLHVWPASEAAAPVRPYYYPGYYPGPYWGPYWRPWGYW